MFIQHCCRVSLCWSKKSRRHRGCSPVRPDAENEELLFSSLMRSAFVRPSLFGPLNCPRPSVQLFWFIVRCSRFRRRCCVAQCFFFLQQQQQHLGIFSGLEFLEYFVPQPRTGKQTTSRTTFLTFYSQKAVFFFKQVLS